MQWAQRRDGATVWPMSGFRSNQTFQGRNMAGARALCDLPLVKLAFDRGAYASDPRIAAMAWDR